MSHKTALFFCRILATYFCIVCIVGVSKLSACDSVPVGQTFRIRLLQPVSSYSSKPGSSVRGMLIESPECDGVPIFASGTIVEGDIKSIHKVGMGFRHEIAAIEFEFRSIEPIGTPAIDMNAHVIEVDNAREKVKRGVIYGIRGTNTPQDHLTSRLPYLAMLYPQSFLIVPVYRAVFPMFPEPELYFPKGTDLLVELSAPLPIAGSYVLPDPNAEFDLPARIDLDDEVLSLPERTRTLDGLNADIVNLMFLGSRQQVEGAFTAAGWESSEEISGRTTLREIDAFLMLRNYPRGPMMKELYLGLPSDFAWQKGLDSLARRDHLRIWSSQDTWQGEAMWPSSSTRDVGAFLSLRHLEFIHEVDANIDSERARIVRDLTLAGCVHDVHYVERDGISRSVINATGEPMRTDGAIAVIQLRDCEQPKQDQPPDAVSLPTRPNSRFARYFRTQVLSARDIWRENVVYCAFDLTRISLRAIHRRQARTQQIRDQANQVTIVRQTSNVPAAIPAALTGSNE